MIKVRAKKGDIDGVSAWCKDNGLSLVEYDTFHRMENGGGAQGWVGYQMWYFDDLGRTFYFNELNKDAAMLFKLAWCG